MNLRLKNVLQFGEQTSLSDFKNALFLKGDTVGGASRTLCLSILPPEMIAKVKAEGVAFNQFNHHWIHVYKDANILRAITPHERQEIARVVKSWVASNVEAAQAQSWKDEISSSLETIAFEDLPFELSKCDTVEEFSVVWERMFNNYLLWKVVRPRVDNEKQFVYMVKIYEDRMESRSLLPFALLSPSEKIDVWMFGIFIYELCSGGSPFHSGCKLLEFPHPRCFFFSCTNHVVACHCSTQSKEICEVLMHMKSFAIGRKKPQTKVLMSTSTTRWLKISCDKFLYRRVRGFQALPRS